MENKEINVKELTDCLREEITSSLGGKGDRQVYEYIEKRILTDPSLQGLRMGECKRLIEQGKAICYYRS